MGTARIRIKDSRRLKLFCFVIFFIAIMVMQSRWIYSYDYPHTQSVIVSSGDSLWGIASEYKSESEDIREFIYKIKELNLLETSEVFEGQELRVPVY